MKRRILSLMSRLFPSAIAPHGPWIVVGLVGMSLYANSISNGFVRDDKLIVRDNPSIRSLGSIPSLFRSNYWSAKGANAGAYRPLTMMSYALNHAVGGLDPRGYHLVNVLAHGIVSLLLYALMIALTRSKPAAFVAAVLFAVHPVHVEAVANVAGRADLLAGLMVLSALLAHRAARLARGRRQAYLYLVAALVFGTGLLVKENVITFLVLPLLYEACFGSRENSPGPPIKRGMKFLPYGGYLGIALGYLALRAAVLGGLTAPSIPYQANPLAHVDLGTRVLGGIALLSRYAKLFLYPKALQCDYSVDVIAPTTSPTDPLFLAGLGIVAVALLFFVRQWSRAPHWSFLIGFTAVTYSIVSNLFVPIGTIMGERLLYLPSTGLCALSGLGFVQVHTMLRRRGRFPASMATGVLALLLLLLGWRTVTRNLAWRSDRALYLTDVEQAPRSAKLRGNAGWVLLRDGEVNKAIAHLEESLKIYPTPQDTYLLGRAYGAAGDEQRKREFFRRTAERYPSSFWGESSQAWIAVWEGRYGEARDHFKVAAELHPFDGTARYNLGVMHLELGDYEAALKELEQATGLSSASERKRYKFLGELLERLGRFGQAVAVYVKAADIFPEETEFWERRRRIADAQAMLQDGRPAAARDVLIKLLAQRPNDTETRLHLAEAYRAMDDIERALETLEGSLGLTGQKGLQRFQLLGECYLLTGRIEEAITTIHAGLGRFPEDPVLRRRLAIAEEEHRKRIERKQGRFIQSHDIESEKGKDAISK